MFLPDPNKNMLQHKFYFFHVWFHYYYTYQNALKISFLEKKISSMVFFYPLKLENVLFVQAYVVLTMLTEKKGVILHKDTDNLYTWSLSQKKHMLKIILQAQFR